VTISPLRILRSEAIQDCVFGVFKVGQAQDGLGDVASSFCFMTGGLRTTDP